MRNICWYLFFCTCIITGCNKMLDEQVVSSVTDEFYNTPAGFQSAINAGYAGLRAFYSTERGMTVTVFGTDTYTNGSDGDFKFANQYTSQLDARYAHLREIWNAFYQAINAANAAVTRADAIPDLDSVAKRSGVAQARFCRANYYFLMVQMFGAVPLRLVENTQPSSEAHRDPVPDVYNAIIADLRYAAQILPVTQAEWGRATKPAAEHLLARVFLTKATSEAKAAGDYDSAATYATRVISQYGMQLLPDPAQVWAQGKENNAETIWAVQYTTDALYNYADNNACRFFLMQYDILGGMKRDLANGTPWKRFRPTKFLLDTLFADRVNDVRYEKFFTSVWFANAGSAKLKIGDTSVYMPGYDVSDAEIASKNYQLVPPRAYTERLYPSLNKFADALRPDNQASGVRPFIAYRLAEDYLIAAEALMYSGKRGEAIGYINTLRMRSARIGATEEETNAHREAMKISDAQLTIDFILDERGRELVGEQQQWFDLVRTNKLLERVRLHNPQGGPNIEQRHMLRPIPQDQIDRTNNEFPQNPGY